MPQKEGNIGKDYSNYFLNSYVLLFGCTNTTQCQYLDVITHNSY